MVSAPTSPASIFSAPTSQDEDGTRSTPATPESCTSSSIEPFSAKIPSTPLPAFLTPNHAVVECCGSRSMTSTRRPFSPRAAARLTLVVVFPLPPSGWQWQMSSWRAFPPHSAVPGGNRRQGHSSPAPGPRVRLTVNPTGPHRQDRPPTYHSPSTIKTLGGSPVPRTPERSGCQSSQGTASSGGLPVNLCLDAPCHNQMRLST